MIETYGQTPAKLFSERHPEKKRQTVDQSSTISGTFTDCDSYSKSSVSERSSQRLVQGIVKEETKFFFKLRKRKIKCV